jgi:hypothetical protein
MKVKVKANGEFEVDIDYNQAFYALCQTLGMDWAIEERKHFVVEENDFGEKVVCVVVDGEKHIYDDRGELFLAIRNLAEAIFPNIDWY